MVTAPARVLQAQFAHERGMGLRRAYALTGVSRSSLYYRYTMPAKDEAVLSAMRELSGKHPRFGSRRIRVLLRCQGIVIGKTRCRRLWVKGGLQFLERSAARSQALRCKHRVQREQILCGAMISCMICVLMVKSLNALR